MNKFYQLCAALFVCRNSCAHLEAAAKCPRSPHLRGCGMGIHCISSMVFSALLSHFEGAFVVKCTSFSSIFGRAAQLPINTTFVDNVFFYLKAAFCFPLLPWQQLSVEGRVLRDEFACAAGYKGGGCRHWNVPTND